MVNNRGRTAKVKAVAAREGGRMNGKVSVDWDASGNLRIWLEDQADVTWFDENIYYLVEGPPDEKYDWEWPPDKMDCTTGTP